MVDAVLLEWEGVLADTAVARHDAMLRALADEGLAADAPAVTAQCELATVYAAAAASVAGLGRHDPTLVDLLTLRATRAFSARLETGFVLLPGAREFVERAQLAAPIAIVTRATRADTEYMLRLSGLECAITTLVSADDSFDPPPSPAMINRALENLGRTRPLQRGRVVALASTAGPLDAARAAGIRSVAVRAPAHVALRADGAVDAVDGLSLRDLSVVSGLSMAERHP